MKIWFYLYILPVSIKIFEIVPHLRETYKETCLCVFLRDLHEKSPASYFLISYREVGSVLETSSSEGLNHFTRKIFSEWPTDNFIKIWEYSVKEWHHHALWKSQLRATMSLLSQMKHIAHSVPHPLLCVTFCRRYNLHAPNSQEVWMEH